MNLLRQWITITTKEKPIPGRSGVTGITLLESCCDRMIKGFCNSVQSEAKRTKITFQSKKSQSTFAVAGIKGHLVFENHPCVK